MVVASIDVQHLTRGEGPIQDPATRRTCLIHPLPVGLNSPARTHTERQGDATTARRPIDTLFLTEALLTHILLDSFDALDYLATTSTTIVLRKIAFQRQRGTAPEERADQLVIRA